MLVNVKIRMPLGVIQIIRDFYRLNSVDTFYFIFYKVDALVKSRSKSPLPSLRC